MANNLFDLSGEVALVIGATGVLAARWRKGLRKRARPSSSPDATPNVAKPA